MKSGRSSTTIADYYDRVAETWDKSHGAERLSPRFARQMHGRLKLLFADIPSGAQALELGAGTGPYIGITAALFGSVIATDLSEGMLAVFARRLRALGLPNVTLMQQDACELTGIAPQSVDVVYSVGLLETIANFDRLFGAFHRVLKPHGIVAGISSRRVPLVCREAMDRRRRAPRAHRDSRHGGTTFRRFVALRFRAAGNRLLGSGPSGSAEPVHRRGARRSRSRRAPTPLARYLGVLSFRASKRSF
jgi:ubiquinone/menaquinone biosynthesis C-methylase UbiE